MVNSKKLLLLGGGGHCKSVLDSISEVDRYNKIAIIDKKENVGNSILGVEIIGCDDDLCALYKRGYTYAFVTLGSVGNTKARVKLFNKLESIGFKIPNIIDPTAVVSKKVALEKGIYIGKCAIVNVGSYIGKCAIINTGSIIEHDCIVEEFSHIAPGATLCGSVHVGKHAHIGAKSVIKQQTKVGDNTLIGVGSVVSKNIHENVIAYGNPCREVKPIWEHI